MLSFSDVQSPQLFSALRSARCLVGTQLAFFEFLVWQPDGTSKTAVSLFPHPHVNVRHDVRCKSVRYSRRSQQTQILVARYISVSDNYTRFRRAGRVVGSRHLHCDELLVLGGGVGVASLPREDVPHVVQLALLFLRVYLDPVVQALLLSVGLYPRTNERVQARKREGGGDGGGGGGGVMRTFQRNDTRETKKKKEKRGSVRPSP